MRTCDLPPRTRYWKITNTIYYLLLGDPGSGKTTTMKRLARKLLLETPGNNSDSFQYPLVVRLREIDQDASLYTKIADTLGFKYEMIRGDLSRDEKPRILIGGLPIDSEIPKVLNLTQAVLILDGLDEVRNDRRDSIESNITTLAYRLRTAKLIVSSRSGDFIHHFEGLNIIEISPLDRQQVRSIIINWLDDPSDFLTRLENLPYQDLADRPPFLTQLAFFYRNYGYLHEHHR